MTQSELKELTNLGAELGAAKAEIEVLREQVKVLQSDANSWQSGYDKGRNDGSKHRKSEVERLRQHKNEYMDAAEATRKALLAEIESLRNGLKNARYRIEQGRVWNGMGWTLTGLHAHQQQKALDEIDAALSQKAELAPAQDEREAPEEVEVVAHFQIPTGGTYAGERFTRGGPVPEATSANRTYEPLMTVAQHERIVASLTGLAQTEQQPELTVWEGPMPESNGKSNFTAVLMRKGADLFDGISGGMTIARSEYPDRVRYEADCVRWLIGELAKEPCITDYDADKHSGYVSPTAQTAPQREQSGLVEAVKEAVKYLDENYLNQISSRSRLHLTLRAALSAQGESHE